MSWQAVPVEVRIIREKVVAIRVAGAAQAFAPDGWSSASLLLDGGRLAVAATEDPSWWSQFRTGLERMLAVRSGLETP